MASVVAKRVTYTVPKYAMRKTAVQLCKPITNAMHMAGDRGDKIAFIDYAIAYLNGVKTNLRNIN